MFEYLLFLIVVSNVFCEDVADSRIVELPEGDVQGAKYWNGDIYEFYGVPYATAPKGRDRFKPPLPVTPRKTILTADKQSIMCHQTFYTGEDEEEIFLNGEEDCLVMNILVPLIANRTNLVPVVVYIHSGAFAGGSANMGKLHYLARLGVVAITFNYRVGAVGHPITTARNIALSFGYNITGNIKDLTEFYLNATDTDLAIKSLNFFLPNSTFGFSPCIESIENNPEPYLTESPLETLKRGDVKQLAILIGFTKMEGLSRSGQFGAWKKKMNENFAEVLPADLIFKDDKTKEEIAKMVKHYYFKDDEVTNDKKKEYVDYFSDSMFKYPIIKSLMLQRAITTRPFYVYEFSYVGELSTPHHFMDTIKGATHRDQDSYIWDFYGFTKNPEDMDTRDRMTYMWTDFVKFE
uniref:Carboxyl/choline esterase n=1 Tax=Chilo suppressalis TaxID=168631 RepID=A0A0B4RYE2_CHISP|nr:carboxyl/choline esterase [Chilo suppressalis]